MIKINLHDYREELRRISIQKRVLQAGSLVVAAFGLILFSWLMEKSRISMVEMEVRDLEQQVSALQGTVNLVKGMQRKQGRIATILAGIETLRTNQFQATRVLFDVNRGLPEKIWLTSVGQKTKSDLMKAKVPLIFFMDPEEEKKSKKKNTAAEKENEPREFIEISGHALEDQAVADFIERLEKISYFKMVFLFKTEQTLIGQTRVRKFTIYCYLPEQGNRKAT